MNIHVLIAQRKCQYPGQFAPEALAVMDENSHSDNPQFMADAKHEAEQSDDFSAVAVVTIYVPSEEIDARLFPAADAIDGVLVG